jgi:hypothetical protein
VLNLLCAVGLWQHLHPGRAGTSGPLLIGGYGLGLVLIGVCVSDPANGFPLGTLAATQPGAVHALGWLVLFVRFFLARHDWGWALSLLMSALLLLGLFFASFPNASSLVVVKVLCTAQEC